MTPFHHLRRKYRNYPRYLVHLMFPKYLVPQRYQKFLVLPMYLMYLVHQRYQMNHYYHLLQTYQTNQMLLYRRRFHYFRWNQPRLVSPLPHHDPMSLRFPNYQTFR